MRNAWIIWIGVCVLLSTLFLVRYRIVGQAVYGDGIYYWAYTRSLVIDHDLSLKNEGAHTYGPTTNNSLAKLPLGSQRTDLSKNKYYPLGPSLLWIPFFFIAHILTLVGNTLRFTLPTNGYADLYQIVVGLANIGFIIAGLILLTKVLEEYYKKNVALAVPILILLSTNLLYYGSLDVLNSHPSSFLLSCIFLSLFHYYKDKQRLIASVGLGLILGLMALVRLQDGLFVIIPFVYTLQQNFSGKIKRWHRACINLLALAAGAFLSFSPQLLASKIIYGTFFLLPYTLGKNQFYLADNKVFLLIFSPQNGMVFYGPLFLLGIVGIWLCRERLAAVRIPFLLLIIAMFVLVGAWSGWSQGEAFGLRMFISLLPLIAFGVAEVLTRLSKRLSKTALTVLGSLFIAHNLILIAAFHLFFHNPTYIGEQLSQSGKLKVHILQFFLLRK